MTTDQRIAELEYRIRTLEEAYFADKGMDSEAIRRRRIVEEMKRDPEGWKAKNRRKKNG